MMVWECAIPGKETSPWAGGLYKMLLTFPDNYPTSPPNVKFTPPIPHPNVFSTGAVCLSLISSGWKPAITLKQILIGVQALLDEPNQASPANGQASQLLKKGPAKYAQSIKEYAAKCRPADDNGVIIL